MYSVSEEDGYVEICVSVIEPVDRTLLALDYQANLTITLESRTALCKLSHFYNYTIHKH